jgi:hypothetical protein
MKRPRFSLRTLFVLVTLCALAVGWAVYQFNWIRQRHRALEELGQSTVVFDSYKAAPWSIRLFERGIPTIAVDADVARNVQKIRELKRLFPEATICTPHDGLPISRNPNPGFLLIPID